MSPSGRARFHRGVMAENLPGHGLGLNLARQLARLHLGELRLVRSEADWAEVERAIKAHTRPLLIDVKLDPARMSSAGA